MSTPNVIQMASAPTTLFGQLDNREITLWITDDSDNADNLSALAALATLPWRHVISEINSTDLVGALQQQEELSDPMVMRRGFKHVVSNNPADINLPPRALPIFLLNGLPGDRSTAFSTRTRRQNMLTEILRAPIRSLVLVGLPTPQTQQDLSDLWDEGCRPTIYVVSQSADAAGSLEMLRGKPGSRTHGAIELSITAFADILAETYLSERSGRKFLRVRDASGNAVRLDITSLDDPERPILSKFETISDSALHSLLASDLLPDEIQDFFGNFQPSWRPYAAGVPFYADSSTIDTVMRALQELERNKADFLRVRFISAEDGAGATTLLRSICWEAASRGFPALLAGDTPFAPNANEVSSYLSRINSLVADKSESSSHIIHEVPWVIAFDRGIWDGHEDDLVTFVRRLETLGRQVTIVVVIGPFLPIPFYNNRRFEKIATLSHILSGSDAERLGTHLNSFLSRIGAHKSIDQWRAFLRDSTIHSDGRQAAFWVVLSFWLRGRFSLEETFDAWIYKQFETNIDDIDVVHSILRMSALASERTAMPYALLPPTKDFPVSTKLLDAQTLAPALGIIMLSGDHGKYWTILHQSVADALLRGFFHDAERRETYGYGGADNPTHLSLQILTLIAADPKFAEVDFRVLAERFATNIFKIDPERGHARFTPYWREAIEALERMPETFRKSNRAFLHHIAISRRRIVNDQDTFPLSDESRYELLKAAISDINIALSIPPTEGAETDLNLYNSLARAYYDLANVEVSLGAKTETIRKTQRKAEEATFNAYRLNPNNSFVIETYVESLLVNGRNDADTGGKYALEALALVYFVLARDELSPRRYSLTKLADRAFDLLVSSSHQRGTVDPSNPIDAIGVALEPFVNYEERVEGMELADYPVELREQVSEGLASPALRDNPQAVKLRYTLTCIDRSDDFDLQLALLVSLGDVEGIVTPQMLLEKAVLLYQNGRHFEGNQMFEQLRRLWRARTHFVEVPKRLHWLIDPLTKKRRQVKARVIERGDFRSLAAVEEFGDAKAVLRPREFDDAIGAPGSVFAALVSFGHNGPFLRPLTAR